MWINANRLLFLLFLLFSLPTVLAQSAFVVAVGDSLTAGDGDDGPGGGYPARLLTLLQTPYPGSTMHNLAISGDTTEDLINKQLAGAVSRLAGAPDTAVKMTVRSHARSMQTAFFRRSTS